MFHPEFAGSAGGGRLDQATYRKMRLHMAGIAEEAADHHIDVVTHPEHEAAIKSYTWESRPLNQYLINPKAISKINHPSAIQKIQATHQLLLKAAQEVPPAHSDMDVYSGVSGKHAERLIANYKKGDTASSRAWVSATFNPDVARKFAASSGSILHVHVREGQAGLMHCQHASFHPNERETIIRPGTRLKINNVYEAQPDRKRIISASIVD